MLSQAVGDLLPASRNCVLWCWKAQGVSKLGGNWPRNPTVLQRLDGPLIIGSQRGCSADGTRVGRLGRTLGGGPLRAPLPGTKCLKAIRRAPQPLAEGPPVCLGGGSVEKREKTPMRLSGLQRTREEGGEGRGEGRRDEEDGEEGGRTKRREAERGEDDEARRTEPSSCFHLYVLSNGGVALVGVGDEGTPEQGYGLPSDRPYPFSGPGWHAG